MWNSAPRSSRRESAHLSPAGKVGADSRRLLRFMVPMRGKRPRWLPMRKLLRWLIGLLLVLIVALVGLILAKDAIFKALAERSVHQCTGLRAVIGQFNTTLGSAAFRLRDLKLYNAPEFGGTLLAD